MEKGHYLTAILRSPKTVFTYEDIALLWGEPSSEATRVRLHSYVKHGKLYRIRRGLYAKDRSYNKFELATRIFTPAYVSFETVLAKEGVTFQFYSPIFVASYLTREIAVDGQVYSFRRIKNPVLTNPAGVEHKDKSSIATKERAFLDTLYIQTDYHFDNLSGLDWDKVFAMLSIYQNKRMGRKVSRIYKQSGNTKRVMKLDISTHKTILFQILKDVYSDTRISPFLGFKGGTAALMFYGLDRFSVDLDFDLLDPTKEDDVFERMGRVLRKHGSLKESTRKRFSLFYVLSYEDKAHNIKVEINRRQFGSRYEIRTYLGVSMQVMVRDDMFAHKLMAMHERIGKTSRDIYDVWFFLQHRFPINKGIVEQRSKLPYYDLLRKCIGQLEKTNNRHILGGVGELLTGSQKDWAKAKLRQETISLLKLRLESGG